jgi:predicted DCC family thiol-disulfide oxidoreductase YuxK
MARFFVERGFIFKPLQSDDVRGCLHLPETELLRQMRVITPDGEVHGGADALLYLARALPAGNLLRTLMDLPGAKALMRRLYAFVARNRGCAAGHCTIERTRRLAPSWRAWIPLIVMTGFGLVAGRALPPWVYMWTICIALFFGFKWIVFQKSMQRGAQPHPQRTAGFLFGWIGMDAANFFRNEKLPTVPALKEWLVAWIKIAAGIGLIWIVPRWALPIDPLLAGWIGMLGLVLVLHFGFFELLALNWQRAGINALPLMQAPIKAQSLGEFWGRRWNTGFHQLANEFAFRPLGRVFGLRFATLFVFALSGLLHDLVISVPARGGYGLPTAYFLIQGLGILFEHTTFARRRGLGRGWRGWLFTVVITAGPAFWLFHPPFIQNVMIPFLKSLNAL